MNSIPTDQAILEDIFRAYYATFSSYTEEDKTRTAKIYVPIDVKAVAHRLRVDPDIVFGRLYYHFEKKHSYVKDNRAKVHFFALTVGDDGHCINFPLLASVLADLQEEQRRFAWSTRIAIAALVVALLSFSFDAAEQFLPPQSEAPLVDVTDVNSSEATALVSSPEVMGLDTSAERGDPSPPDMPPTQAPAPDGSAAREGQ